MERREELAEKRKRLKSFLHGSKLDCAVLSSQSSFSWYTCGGENRVVLCSERGVAAIVADGTHDVVVTTNIEARRVEEEELKGLDGFEVRGVPWQDEAALARELERAVGKRKAAAEGGAFGLPGLSPGFAELTYSLLPSELERYEKLGELASEAMEASLERVRPGMTENEVQAAMADELLKRGCLPHVLLVAADERIRLYRHPPATEKKFETHLMAVMCARRWGLIASLTRFLYAGEPPGELREKHVRCCRVDAALIGATAVGRAVGEVFREGLRAYDDLGFPEEWKLHHQGGPTGYQSRSYKGTVHEKRRVLANQAYAWNPSITGTKSEDTILATKDGVRFLTRPLSFPALDVEWEQKSFRRADIKVI